MKHIFNRQSLVSKFLFLILIFVLSCIGVYQKYDFKEIVPSLVPSELTKNFEGKIIQQPGNGRGKDDGLYLVKDGARIWIVNGSWLMKNEYRLSDINQVNWFEFNSIKEKQTPIY